MSFEYYVAVDSKGHAGCAATRRSVVEEEAAATGASVVKVNANNAFAARRLALALWAKDHEPATVH